MQPVEMVSVTVSECVGSGLLHVRNMSERLLFIVTTRLHSEYWTFSCLTSSRLQLDDKGSKCQLSTRGNVS